MRRLETGPGFSNDQEGTSFGSRELGDRIVAGCRAAMLTAGVFWGSEGIDVSSIARPGSKPVAKSDDGIDKQKPDREPYERVRK